MSKLKDQMTSQELLELILNGTMKSELIKKHRSSDEELATMLLPLYRNGELTKEEFNDFFKGVSLSPRRTAAQQTEDPARAPSKEDLPPSEILRSLAPDHHESSEEAKDQAEEPRARGVLGPDDAPPSAGDVDFSDGPEPPLHVQSEPAVPPPQDTSASFRSDSAEVDAATVSSVLDMILAKLGSIDTRLAALERKLGGD